MQNTNGRVKVKHRCGANDQECTQSILHIRETTDDKTREETGHEPKQNTHGNVNKDIRT